MELRIWEGMGLVGALNEAEVGGSGTAGAIVKLEYEVTGNWGCMVGGIGFESEHTAPDNPDNLGYLAVFV